MKKAFTLLVLVCFYAFSPAQATVSFYTYSWPNFAGTDTVSMGQYKGTKLMIVNVAAECVFTSNFGPLEQLDSAYSKYNFHVIGFPCNDFDHEQGSDSLLLDTCKYFGVNFPLMASVSIVTGDTAPVYKWLQCKSLNGVENAGVNWNFNMFLIDRTGNWVRWISSLSLTSPLDTSITNWIVDDSASLTGITPITGHGNVDFKSSNPTNSNIALQVSAASPATMDITLLSADGREIGKIYHGNVEDGQVIQYPVNTLASGVYLVKVTTGEEVKVLRAVVTH
jgi:glutathione peroxidase